MKPMDLYGRMLDACEKLVMQEEQSLGTMFKAFLVAMRFGEWWERNKMSSRN